MKILNEKKINLGKKYFLSIDGGGSYCKGMAGVDFENAKVKISKTTSLFSASYEEVLFNLNDLISNIEKELNISRDQFKAACIGSTGLGRETQINTFKKILKEIKLDCPILLCSDAEIALFGAVKNYGAVLIVGTGSIAYAIDKQNNIFRKGGFGHLLGDIGSGYWIGKESITQALRKFEYYNDNYLLQKILTFFKLKNQDQLINFVYENFEKEKLASITPLILSLSEDETVKKIIEKTIKEWVLLSRSILSQVNMNSISYMGSILEKNTEMRDKLSLELKNHNIQLQPPKMNALEGAFLKALNYLNNLS